MANQIKRFSRHSQLQLYLKDVIVFFQDLRRLGLEYTATDMSVSALYLHELHHRMTSFRLKVLLANLFYYNEIIILSKLFEPIF
jgi:hypothetical protein